jgi:hypothetical protein
MDFSRLLKTLGGVQGRDAWVAVTNANPDVPRAAVLHGSLGEVESGRTAFLPVEVPREPALSGSVGVALDPREFEGAEGSLPGNLVVRMRDCNVCVATRW